MFSAMQFLKLKKKTPLIYCAFFFVQLNFTVCFRWLLFKYGKKDTHFFQKNVHFMNHLQNIDKWLVAPQINFGTFDASQLL